MKPWALAAVALLAVACRREPSPAETILGCWNVTASADPRYPAGEVLCLHPRGMVVLSGHALGNDAWEVNWTASGNEWRGVVPPGQTQKVPVEFIVTRGDAGAELTVRSGGGWLDVTLARRFALRGEQELEQARACRECLDDEVRERGPESEPGGPIYSLRTCKIMLRAMSASCPALNDSR